MNDDIDYDDIDPSLQQYESSLVEAKDERDAIQKKTFTKWVNKHLIKVTKGVVDLFEDLRDGHNLISLLEVLSGELLPRERGRMRVHMLQNIQICLNFLKRRKIKLVNIRPDDIVDGNPKLTLGLIWTIILHFQLSDIVLHDDTQSFREALLRWAQKTTEGYPGVRVTDFTQSWRDGLAFNAILHRNRPDLLDYRSCRGRTARENLENAFHIADKDLGVTRLLDPEDVDTPHPDEKSLITYISSLYELFPEPPEHNPLLDLERIRRIDEYKELASRLCVWMRESISRLRERNFPNVLQELKILQQENNRFRTEEIPPKLHDKQRLASSYKDILKMIRALPGGHHRIEEDYKIENIEHQWNKLITAHQERDHAISEEVNRLERLHRLAEKLLRDIKQCDVRLDDIERQIVEEEKRVQRLHPLEGKFNIEKIEAELRQEEDRIKSMFKDVQTLREGRYHKATELHNRVQQLHQRWADMKLDFQTRVVQALADRRAEALKKPLTEEELIASNPSFRFLHECILWVQEKLKKLDSLDFGHDMQSVKDRLDEQKAEHRAIDQFQTKVDQCDRTKQQFKGEEYEVYTRMLNRLHKGYSELLVMSNKRLSDLDTLLDFVQSATNELKWLADKEEVEVSRDWSSKTLNLIEVEQYHRQLISDMERREHQFNVVQDRGESLIRQRHPATKCIEGLMARMQSQWSWLLQLINCLETHSKNSADYQQFYNEARDCDQWISKTEDKLNTTYSKQNFSIEEGEQLLKEMSRLKEDITRFATVVTDLVSKSKDVYPLKQRKAALPRPIKARSVCLIKQGSATITKNETVTLHDNSQRSKWRVSTATASELNVPGVCFVIPPPDQEAIDTANELKRKYEALVVLWARKQHKLRQNMIFATLKIVKGWDYPTYCAMDPNQRDSIIRALEDDIDKLCREGPPDDPGSKRLRDEMDALKKKFAEFDARRRAEDEEKSNKTLTKKYTDVADNLLQKLLEKEKILVQRAHNPIPRDRETLENLVIEHKEWESDVKSCEHDIERAKELFHNIPQKSHAVQRNHDELLETWNRIWTLSSLYIERLKAVETLLLDIVKATEVIGSIEVRLASGDDMAADEVALRRVHNELIDCQNDIQRSKSTFDELNASANKVRRIVERTRPKAVTHSDLNRVEEDLKNLFKRWDNLSATIVERLRSCEACADLLRSYKKRIDSDRSFLSQTNAKVNTLLTRPDLGTATKIYESLVERKPSIEDTNASGGRFIREAKIYDLKIKSYRESLEDAHPSLDASAKRSRRNPGADIVAQELDQLNKEYSELLDAVSQLLNQLQDDEAKLQEKRLISRISFRTYRSDLGLAVNQTSNQMDINNDFNSTTSVTTSSNQHMGPTGITGRSDQLIDRMSAKTCKTTSSLVLKSSDSESQTKKSIDIEQRLTQFVGSDQTDSALDIQPTGQTQAQALTFTEIKSSRRQKSESTETELISPKRDTCTRSENRSPSPPSPKKAKSASDIVRESMKSKRISNKVESRFDHRSRSPTKHSSVQLSSSSEIIANSEKSDKSESSPERMSYSSGSSPSPSSRVSTKEYVSHKYEYRSDSDSKSMSSRRSSPDKETAIDEVSSSTSHSVASKDMYSKSEIKSIDKREPKKSAKPKTSKERNGKKFARSDRSVDEESPERDSPSRPSDKPIDKRKSKRASDSKYEAPDGLSSQTFTERRVETDVIKSETGLTSQSVSTESTAAHTQVLELPPEGWSLQQAIHKQHFDPQNGLFSIPGTDRQVSFEETIRLEIIDPNSAVVIEPSTKRKISLLRSFHKGVVDSTGHYVDPKAKRKLSLKEAIDSKLICFQEGKPSTSKSKPITSKILKITTTEGEPDRLDVIVNPELSDRSLDDIPESTTLKSEQMVSQTIREQFVEIADGIYYSPQSNAVLVNKTGQRMDLMAAIDRKLIDPSLFSVTHPVSGKTMTMADALKAGVIDKKTGDIVSKKGEKKSITEMAKQGLMVLAASPLALTAALEAYMDSSSRETAISKIVVSDSDNERKPDAQSRIKAVKDDSDASTTRVVRETVQVIKSKELLLKDPKTGKEVPLDEAVKSGLIDEQTAQNLKERDASQYGYDVKRKRELTIQDPATGVPLPLKMAVKRGIIDSDTAKRLERGEIVENLVSTNVTVVDSTNGNKTIPREKILAKSEKPKSIHSPPKSSSASSSPSPSPSRSPTRSPTRSRSPPKTLEPLKEPRFEVAMGSAQSMPSPEREVVIKRVPKRYVSPKTAVEDNLIDAETAQIIASVPQSMPLEEAIIKEVIDGEKGSILEPQSGEKLSIRKALHSGLIDSDSKALVYPIGRSLSLPSIIEKGLYNPKERRIIHSETGQLLTLDQAIACDIVDKHSKVIDPKTKKAITLEEALNKGVIDPTTCDITTASERRMSLVEAVKTNYITLPQSLSQKEAVARKESQFAGLALTFRAALENDLIDLNNNQFVHPITGEQIPIAKAIEKGLLTDMTKHKEETLLEDSYVVCAAPEEDTLTKTKPSTSQIVQAPKRSSVDKDKLSQDLQKADDNKLPKITQDTIGEGVDTVDGQDVVFSIDSKAKSQLSASVVRTTVETLITSTGEVTMRASSALQSMGSAMKSGELNLAQGTFTSPSTGQTISITEALRRNLLKSQEISTQTDDELKRFTISGAFNCLHDKESGLFKEPVTGELVSFEKLVDKGVIDLEAVIYDAIDGTTKTTRDAILEGRIDSKTGNLIDPRTKKRLSVSEATQLGLMAVVGAPLLATQSIGGAVKQTTSESRTSQTEGSPPVPQKQTASIKSQTEVNKQEISTSTTVTTCDLRTYTEAAIMEKFKLCEDNIRQLSQWLTDIEQNLANLGTVREQVEEVKKQLSICESINKDLESHQRQVATTLDYAHVIAQQGAEFMSKEDITRIQKTTDSLKKRYDSACDHSDRLLRRLTSSLEELTKFRTEFSSFKKWLEGAQRSLADKEKAIKTGRDVSEAFRELTNDVIAHQADLRFIAMASQRFMDEAKDYLSSLNEYRLTLPQRLRAVEESEYLVKTEVNELSKDYYDLLERVNALSDRLSGLSDKQRNFADAYDKASRWLNEVKRSAKKLLDEPVAAEPRAIGEQLDRVRALSNEVHSNSRLIDNVKHTGRSLLENLEQIGVSSSERRAIEDNIRQLENDYKDIVKGLSDRERKLDLALLQAGKFQDALTAALKWLTDTEEEVANQKPISADYKVVKAQLQEQKLLKKLIQDREHSIQSLISMGRELIKNLDSSERTPIERQVNDISRRFDKLMSDCNQRMEALEHTLPIARAFAEKLGPLQDWLESSERKLSSLSSQIPTDQDRIRKRIAEHRSLHQDIISHKREFEELTEIAQNLMTHVGDDEAQVVVERLQEVTDRYAKLVEDSIALGLLLNESHEVLGSFVLSFEDLLAWIQEMESRLNRYRVLSIYVDKLKEQVDELTEMAEEIQSHEHKVSDVVRSGQEIMKHSSGGDSIFIKDKLDALQSRFSELTHRTSDKLMQAREALPIAQNFHLAHNKLNAWMDDAERELKNLGSINLSAQEKLIKTLEQQIPENRTLLETINHLGPQLGQISPGQGAATIEGYVTRASRRFDAICEQIQRKAERIALAKQRNNEVITDIDELLDWFRDAERQLLEAEPITPNPDALAILLKETKALYDDINSQKGRVRDVITNAKKLMRESSGEDMQTIRDKAEDLKELANHVAQLCQDRLSALEQALPLAVHFFEAHSELCQWLDEAEGEAQMLGKPAIHAAQIRRQQEAAKSLMQSVAEHKPLVDRLNKTGAALMRLIFEDDARQVQKLIDSDNDRYNQLRNFLREQQNALEAALQATSQFADKLDGMLNALNNTADQLRNAEPIAAHPDRIQEQILDNNAIIKDLENRAGAVHAIKEAAKDVISKAGKSDEPAIRDIKNKLNKLNDLWDEVQKGSKSRGRSLDDALKVAEKFWNELNNVMKAIRDLQDTLNSQEPPAAEPNEIKEQQKQLKEIKHDMEQTKPEVERTKQTGRNLLQLCGEPDKPEIKKHMEDLDNAWENVTSLYAKREQNLIDAMEKAMNFHEMMKNLLEFLDRAERKFNGLGPIAADIDAVKRQIRELKDFQSEVNPHMVEVEALNRQAQELLEDVHPDKARSIRGPIKEINRRWDDLLKNIVDRSSDLDNALLRLGQFQHALNEFLAWITKTERTLDDMRPVFGDPPVIEVELAKHKVLMNDIQAHQTSLETLNIAGKQMMASESGTESARTTQTKLNDLNSRWEQLLDKAHSRQRELEEALKEAQAFNQEIQDLLIWLNEVDQQLSSSKPVGGLPETAREQLNRFMELFHELESMRPKVESTLKQGDEYLRRSTEGAATNLQHNLKTLKSRWENVLIRANDRKTKLEIALRDATEFHEALQEFVDWLTSSEKYLSNLQPVSRVVDNVLQQIEEHKHFQKDIGAHRETMLNLDKKGTHLKYFSQKQDVILIKNLLVSVQHRWERVVSKAAERSRALDHGLKEAREFHECWSELISWLDDAEKTLDSIQQMGNNPEFIKQMLSRHKEFQRSLGAKQSVYDSTIRMGRSLKEKAPKPDIPILQEMLDELKNKWNAVCNKSVDRQRKLEEALLYSGQFKDAIQALIDWLDKAKRELDIDQPVYGDLDTVTALVDQHKAFQEDFKSRAKNLQSVRKTASDLLQSATIEDARHIKEQMSLLESKWEEVERLSEKKERKLEDALRQAEQLHKSVHMLLEWLSDAEMKLRFAGPLPEDESTTRQQIAEHERFMREMSAQEKNKDSTIALAQEILQKCHPDATPVIKHWITIIQSRWEEVASWAQQREQRLQDHLRSLRNIMELLEELMAWLIGAEASLLAAEAQPLPDDVLSLERLIEEHQRFIDDMIRREPDVEKVAKAFSSKRTIREEVSKRVEKGRIRGLPPRTSTPTRGHAEPEIKHPRARELLEKWRVVWKLAMDRMKRLQDKLNFNRELDRMRNFDFDEWRRRFLGWMNNKKARIMDFYRKIDTDNDGKVTNSQFIEGFLNSKFPTTRLEMDRVVDIFDRNNDGYVDQQEYWDTLRPDREPQTEAEIIQDQVQRQVSKCTCLVRYKVFQVGEGRYRFGESQKLRLVRILRSTVMVRVGGGWVSLDEFLLKNDPCRAAGRTNVELREQFILADGVSQSMTPFKSKSPIIKPDGTIPTTGPITKIREKSERSVPMSHQYRYGNSTSDYSFSDQHDSSGASKGRPRSRLTIGSGSKPNSTPGSRHSSRPASRASSDMSVESLEGYQQRRTTSLTRSKLSYSTQSRNGTNGTRERWK